MNRQPVSRRAIRVLSLFGLALIACPAAGSDFNGQGWPYSPPKRPALPEVQQQGWTRNAIDAFVLARLEKAGLRPSPAADKAALLRRVTHDLLGLAPTEGELAAFLADQSPDAYEKAVDRLLASPRFGERWAQHWLDVVRYAESEGFKLDRHRNDAYRYRDYVIRAFNDDLPYDRFIKQQIAGDELEPDNPDALIATGFYRLHPEESNGGNYQLIRQDILDDITDVFGVTFMGLTLECARCHHHKFDPIPQQDYYRLQAFFAPLVHRDDGLLASADAVRDYRKKQAAWDEATRPIRSEIQQLFEPISQQLFEESVVTFDSETQRAMRTAPGKRSMMQRQLVTLASKQIDRKYARMHRRLTPDQKIRFEALQKKLAEYDALKPAPLPTAMSVTDVGPEAPVTRRLASGNYLRPREEVQPGFPACLDMEGPRIGPANEHPQSTGRRSALARWLCQPNHPLTARVIVNRLWQQYLGRGIVATPNDFGAMGDDPTHPLLLDYLATELVRKGWKLKAIHRLIVTSAVYRQSSRPDGNPAAEKADPTVTLLWRARMKRRDAESIRDAALQAAGQLNARMYGPSARPELPGPVFESRYAWYADEQPEDRNRRSIYVLARRNLQYPLFAVFDLPDRHFSCGTRSATTTATQALAMLNGELMTAEARGLAGLLLARTGSLDEVIRQAYARTVSRPPTAKELTEARQFIHEQMELIGKEGGPAKESLPAPLPAKIDPVLASAVVDLCHALLASAEFLYIE